ncbi:MAG TPA: XrtA/PEP-CTERM system-associated ATPase [Sphingobium sp.]|uniref:XrtA/PEP-CTERM system-associated ATPase n=1 Tax=Sphingobium sp. TaxID=1912891 RepID=UPI002ECFB335
MYDQYYGFTGRPFQLTPDPAFYFESGTHRKAMSYLGYGLAQGEGFIVITGDIGAGKTTLVGHLMATIDPRRLTAVQLVSTQVGGDDMLRLTAQNFGIEAEGVEKAALLTKIEGFLHAQARAGKRSLLVVDEAQNLSISALEELRMLSNFTLGGQSLLQIFLLGQPEFREVLSGEGRLEQLCQRIIATHHLEPMQAEEVAPYIEHRLRLVGWTGNPRFTPDAYQMLADASAGVPRRLNALVSRVLLLGALDKLDMIDRRVIEAVIADSGVDASDPHPVPVTPARAGALSLAETLKDVAAPEASSAAPMIAPEELHAIRGEVAALSRAFSDMRANAAVAEPVLDPRIDAIEARLTVVEHRAQEQEEVLRRILAKLIEWAERDERQGPFANRAA